MVLSSYSIKSSFKKKTTDAWTSLAESLTQADGQYSHIVAILNKLLQRILRKAKHEAPPPPHPGHYSGPPMHPPGPMCPPKPNHINIIKCHFVTALLPPPSELFQQFY